MTGSDFEGRGRTYLCAIAAMTESPAADPDEVAQLIPYDVFQLLIRLEAGAERASLDVSLLSTTLDWIAARRDCADFALAGLIRLMFRHPTGARFTKGQRTAIDRTVLDFSYWFGQSSVRGMCFHTENHQILFHSCELLAGQLFPDQIFSQSGKSGRWHAEQGARRALKWIDQRARFGFSEWLSCYYDEDLLALLNLYDFAADETVKKRAGMLVDMLLFEIALHSHRGIMGSSHGRTYAEFIKGGRRDPTTAINWLLFGTGLLDVRRPGIALTALSTSGYRCPPLIEAIALDDVTELLCREQHGLDLEDSPRFGLSLDDLDDSLFFWSCQTSRHPRLRATAARLAKIADDPWLARFVEDADVALPACRTLAEEAGIVFDGDAVNTVLSAANIVTFRTPAYELSCAQDFRPGKPGYQQHIWQATLDADAVVFTTHPGAASENGIHTERPNFWAGNRYLPRAAQHRNVVICIHHVPKDDKLPFSHAYFPREHFDETVQVGNWTFGRKGDAYVALYSQHPALWADDVPHADIELRAADARDNVWICEMGSAAEYGSFGCFVEVVCAAPVFCEGLNVAYESPSQGAMRFGWTGALTANGEEVPLTGFGRYDNPYCCADVGDRRYEVARGDERLVWDFG